jgi:NAD(P)-dependent dehydrogenase (short-subunit alcohol dehydrogenase family)
MGIPSLRRLAVNRVSWLRANGFSASRVAIVTGESRGAGRATIRRLAARGCAVVVNYLHDQRAAESTVEAILARNRNAVAVRADIADDLDVKRLFAETITAFGGIDVVVHAAGNRITASGVTEVDLDEFDALLRINTRATFVVNREAAITSATAVRSSTCLAQRRVHRSGPTASIRQPRPPQTCSRERSRRAA